MKIVQKITTQINLETRLVAQYRQFFDELPEER